MILRNWESLWFTTLSVNDFWSEVRVLWTRIKTSVHVPSIFMKVDALERKNQTVNVNLHLHMCPIISQKEMGFLKFASFIERVRFHKFN